jgi:tryptophanyl-tRNA synthetase
VQEKFIRKRVKRLTETESVATPRRRRNRRRRKNVRRVPKAHEKDEESDDEERREKKLEGERTTKRCKCVSNS